MECLRCVKTQRKQCVCSCLSHLTQCLIEIISYISSQYRLITVSVSTLRCPRYISLYFSPTDHYWSIMKSIRIRTQRFKSIHKTFPLKDPSCSTCLLFRMFEKGLYKLSQITSMKGSQLVRSNWRSKPFRVNKLLTYIMCLVTVKLHAIDTNHLIFVWFCIIK